MITTRRAKELAAAAGLVGLSLCLCIAMLASTALVVNVGSGASPGDAFHETNVIPESLSGRVRWLSDSATLSRQVEPATREAIEGTWVRAFGDLELVAEGHHDVALQTWFVGRALRSAQAHSEASSELVPSAALAHEIRVDFYSADGQILSLTSTSTIRRGTATEVKISTETYQALLILADGNWRIEQLVRGGQTLTES